MAECPERDEEFNRLEERVFDHDRRLLTLETNSKVMDGEINSLRSTRHEHSNWLNRHNLEMQEVNMKVMAMTSQVVSILSKVETMEKQFTDLQISITTQLADIKSDLRQTMWIVSVVVGIIVFVGRGVANKFGF